MNVSHINIYTKRINPRLIYTTHELFNRRLSWEPKLFNDRERFLSSVGPKLNYSDESFEDDIPQLYPAGILFEKRIQHQELDPSTEGRLLKLFPNKNNTLGFDPLSAAFYHLSRYEEYLPHRKDHHGRFDEDGAILVKHACHEVPQVESYTRLLGDWLKSYYPDLSDAAGDVYQHIVTVDVDQLYALKEKGLARTFIGLVKDLLRGGLMKRLSVIAGKQADPNDVYDQLQLLCDRLGHRPILFFQVGEGSRFDHNNPPHLSRVKDKINALAIRTEVGIHPSYYSSDKPALIKNEVERLRSIIVSPVSLSRQHYLKFKLPDTFRHLQELGIQKDFSMAYTKRNGFRAATCMPFRAYDLEREDIMDITFYPGTFMDLSAVRNHLRPEEAAKAAKALQETVRQFNGLFITIWHPEVLSGHGADYPSFPILSTLISNDEVG